MNKTNYKNFIFNFLPTLINLIVILSFIFSFISLFYFCFSETLYCDSITNSNNFNNNDCINNDNNTDFYGTPSLVKKYQFIFRRKIH